MDEYSSSPLSGQSRSYPKWCKPATKDDGPFGPFVKDISPTERVARLRSLRMAVLLMLRNNVELIDALRRAEVDDNQLARARAEIEKIPALWRRHLLASYCRVFGAS
jgi:hypothetical protein